MYLNLHNQGLGNFINTDIYVTSTENDAFSVWGQAFSNVDQNAYDKFETHYVRAIRAF